MRALCGLALLLGTLLPAAALQAAPGDNCSGDFYVNQTLPSGARWQLCWEQHSLSGVIYSDVYYTPPGGPTRKVLYEATLAQIHVPYDDNGARFHDVTDYGLGGSNLNDMTAADCPGGTLLQDGTKHIVCQQLEKIEPGYQHGGRRATGHALKLFSVSHVGAYNYIPTWSFHDDGTIAPSVGATGRLQRFGSNTLYGWPIRSNTTTGISHMHNYHFRLDFDFDDGPDQEVVEEIDHVRVGATREKQVTVFDTEVARPLDIALRRSWRIRDLGLTNAAGRSISYQLEPSHHAHRFDGPSFEPWTANQVYVTRWSSCEKYATHNDLAGGCGSDLSSFVNGQSVYGQDVVVWYSLSFHHLPTDEDEPNMHAHWDGFEIVPRDWSTENPLPEAPAISPPGNPVSQVGESVSLPLATANPAGAALVFSASGLPAGLSISPTTGTISGAASPGSAGNHAVTVTASGTLGGEVGLVSDSTAFMWTVSNGAACADGIDNDGDGAVDTADLGCTSAADTSERDPARACDDGYDNDGDDLVDLLDPGCLTAASASESPACNDGIDNDGDRLIDTVDPGCADATRASEAPACNDGIDNDSDGAIDLADSDCASASGRGEGSPPGSGGCGMGPELALLLTAWPRLRRRRRGRG
jgi:Copper amine oxidase, enzyme domain/Putative Ig domain